LYSNLKCFSAGGNSRLIREDEEDHELTDDEHGEVARGENKRIDFTVDTTARDQERRREAFFAAQDQGLFKLNATVQLAISYFSIPRTL